MMSTGVEEDLDSLVAGFRIECDSLSGCETEASWMLVREKGCCREAVLAACVEHKREWSQVIRRGRLMCAACQRTRLVVAWEPC